MKCPKCSGKTKKSESTRIFHGKIAISPVFVEKCAKCNEEYMSEQEYERVRARVGKIKSEVDCSALKEVQVIVGR